MVCKEADAIAFLCQRIAAGSTVQADEADGWIGLIAYFQLRRIKHLVAFSLDGG